MPLASEMMQGGMSAGQAKAANGAVNSAVTAAGATQGAATQLTASVSVVSTATENQGVILYNGEVSDEQEILNISGAQIIVYPPTSGQINNLSANTGFALANNTAVRVKKFTSTRWMGFLSA